MIGQASSPGRRSGSLALAAVFVAATAVTALDYGLGPGDETLQARRDIHRGILDQTTRAPDRYRVLAPALIEIPARVLSQFMPYDSAYDRASVLFYLLAMAALVGMQYAYLRVWFTADQALIGALLVACTLRITIRQHDYAPSSYLEPTFFALALLAILHGRRGWFAVLLAVATLNRETAIFLIALFAVTQPLTKDTVKAVAAYFAIWLVIFAGLRVLGGEAERYWTLDLVFRTNVSQLWLAAFNITMLLGAFWVFALLGVPRAPAFVRRSALVIPVYLAVVAIWGIWWEVRLLMPLYPLVLPLALSYLFEPRSGARLTSPVTA
jgi:hypothetical protein